MTNHEIIQALNIILPLSQKELPLKLSWAINRNKNRLLKVYETYEIEYNKLLKKYCETDDNGELKPSENEVGIFKTDEDREQYNTDIQTLLTIDNPDIDIFKVSSNGIFEGNLSNCDTMPPDMWDNLQFMFTE